MYFITIFKIAIFLSAVVSTSLAAYVSIRRSNSLPLRFLSGLFVANSVYAFSYFLEISAPGLKQALVFLNLEYAGLTYIPAFWMLLSWSYHPQETIKQPDSVGRLRLILVVPLALCLFVWTNPLHGLVYQDFSLHSDVPVTAIKFDRAFGFWVINACIVSMYLAGAGRMVYNLAKARGNFRTQYTLLIIATILPIATHVLLLMKTVPYNLDIVPISFALSGLFLYWGMTKKQLIDMVPIARTMVFNSMQDAVFVLDSRQRLVDSNHQARVMFLPHGGQEHGNLMKDVHPLLWKAFPTGSASGETVMDVGNEQKVFRISGSPILDSRNQYLGTLYLLHDITELRTHLVELERLASHDGLTNLFNHRQFMKLVAEEANLLEYSDEGGFAIIMFDLDHFKDVNDTYGHSIGDLMLKRLGDLISEITLPTETCARYGGEEFILLCRHASLDDACERAQFIRQAISTLRLSVGDESLSITASFGVSRYDAHQGTSWETALNQADTALYRAKANGRNCVMRYE